MLWWNALDQWSLIAVLLLIMTGILLVMSVSPSIALQHHWSSFVLLKRHLIMVIPGVSMMILVSFSRKKLLIDIGKVVSLVAWAGLFAVFFLGPEIKGAKRWLPIFGFSLQPSEFLKPACSIMVAYLITSFPVYGLFYAGLWTAIMILPLLFQPDLGMVVLISSVSFGQCFIGGISWYSITLVLCGLTSVFAGAYTLLPHVAYRIHSFFSPNAQDPFGSHYQILQGLKSFRSGGFLGKGPGAGTVMHHLPDAHADFIFAVAGEELGFIACIGVLSLYILIVLRGLWYAYKEVDAFHAIALCGLILQIALQVIFNIASVLKMIPTKGMTLPFLSYGGSSFLSLCWAMGMVLALTRRYRILG